MASRESEPKQASATPPPSATAAAIARAVQRRFAALPGNGKPASHEHTVLAGFVVATTATSPGQPQQYTVASLATGTKCLGAGRRREAAAARASPLHDSHAEALARRGLLLWVHAQLRAALAEGGGSAAAPGQAGPAPAPPHPPPPPLEGRLCFRWLPDSTRRRFALLPGVELFLYVSQPPCGDASILHDGDGCVGAGGVGGGGRTGAKLIEPAAAADAAAASSGPVVPQAGHVEDAARPQRAGALRRKPGKGDATLSMSCSDKLARWQVLGLQGALLSSLLEAPLRLSGVVVSVPPLPASDPEDWSAAAADVERAARRAVFERFRPAVEAAAEALRRKMGRRRSGEEEQDGDAAGAAAAAEQLLRSALQRGSAPVAMAAPPPPDALGLAPSDARRVPCGVAINWHSGSIGDGSATTPFAHKAEVTVGAAGCRAGSGRAARDSPSTRSRLSRAALAARYAELLALVEAQTQTPPPPPLPLPLPLSAAEARTLPLGELKRRAAPAYTGAWAALLDGSAAGSAALGEEQPDFAGAWLRKPEDVLAAADFATAAADSAAGSGGGRAAAACGDGEDQGEAVKRARTAAP